MDALNEALKRKRAKAPSITITVADPSEVEVLARDGDGEESSEKDLRDNPDMAPGVYDKDDEAREQGLNNEGDTIGGEGKPGEGVTLTPGAPADPNDEAAEMDPSQVFDEKEFARRKADGQGKPKSLTDRAGFAAFKGRKK